jgi:dipeptidyl-peptidase-3
MRTILLFMTLSILSACNSGRIIETKESGEFDYRADRFGETEVLRYRVAGFEALSLRQKRLLYHLSDAALAGRDLIYDQNCRYNLPVRRMLEAIYSSYEGDRTAAEWLELELYLKRVWFSNGIHHHYGAEKMAAGFSPAFLEACLRSLPASEPNFLREGSNIDAFMAEIFPVIFDPDSYPKRTEQGDKGDLVLASSCNFYAGVSQPEAEAFYAAMRDTTDPSPPSYGLNSRLVKGADGRLSEQVWKAGGLYGPAIERIVDQLLKAAAFAENESQRSLIAKLAEYYRTGNLRTFDEYAILWVKDTASETDFINGFTETYTDPLGIKATWEATVSFVDKEATRRTETISANAAWFEEHSPVDPRFRKKDVTGISAKVITMAMLGGDCYPASPIGINLPNADWIRSRHGSKSVTIGNISEAYDKASQGSGFKREFMWSNAEIELAEQYGMIVDDIHTDLHECLGHGSGQTLPGVDLTALKSYGSMMEEARADLFALYYMPDRKLLDLGIMPHPDAWKATYYEYMLNGLMTQLVRIEPGKDIEEAHMRNRSMIAWWVYQKGKEQGKPAVEFRQREGKTYVVVNDYDSMRRLFAELLAEVQRIKSEGDYEAARLMAETYTGMHDAALHAEVRERYAALNLPLYKGFVNPVMKEVLSDSGAVTDVILDYGESYSEQMQRYSRDYSHLPSYSD